MILDLGIVDYEETYRLQKELVARRRLREISDSLIITEHNPVFTIGRSGCYENLLADENALRKEGIKVLSMDRGGDITFHGPGQIVAYPIIDLRTRGKDLHKYLRDLEEVIIRFLRGYSVVSQRLPGTTGVWTGRRKIASIGIAASDWVTFHGLSININVDLGFFSMIYPCGMRDVEITSLGAVLNKYIPMTEACGKLVSSFNEIFNIDGNELVKRESAAMA